MDHPREEAKSVLLLLLAIAGTTVLTLMVSATPSKGVKPEPCPPGRYFSNESLLPADASSSDEAVVVGGTAISIGDACRAVPVKLWLSKSGTKLRARWKGCASLQGKVRLRATIDPTCSIMAGTLIARKLRFTKHFAARLSICGDGILDIARGEQCDGSIGCGPGEVCTGCVCVANQGTTTTCYVPSSTTSSSSSSTTSSSTSTITTTTQAPTITTTTTADTTTTTTDPPPTTTTTTTPTPQTSATTTPPPTTPTPTSPTTTTATTSQAPTTTTTNTSTTTTTTRPGTCAGACPIHTVFLILMENHDWSSIEGSPSAPYINDILLPIASHAEQYYNPPGVHPSEPNYLWLEAGTNFGIRNDRSPARNHQSTTSHLVNLLEAAGLSWRAYQEDISGIDCPLSNVGLYDVNHDPFVFFDDVTQRNNSQAPRCIQHVRPYSALQTDLISDTVARYNFITPHLCNDMHDACAPLNDPVQQGDAWLSTEVPKILASRAYTNNGALFILWDEGGTGDGPIGMIVLSPKAKGGGYQNAIHYTHSSTLRTLEEIFGVTPLLGDAANATNLSDLFVSFP